MKQLHLHHNLLLMKSLAVPCLLSITLFSSCIVERPTYYVSPHNGNNTSYHAMPLKKDSIKTATYASSSLYFGSANTNQTDKVFQYEGSVYQTKQFGIFEAYYGANVALGNYKVTPFDTSAFYTSANWKALNERSGNKFYQGLGAEGGIDLVHVTRHGEWRIIGAEFSTHQEFGNYLKFRKNLPADAANFIIRNGNFSTLGFNTETVRKTKTGSYSLKFAYGFNLGKAYNNSEAFDFTTQITQHIPYQYATTTFQYTYQKWSGYINTTYGAYAGGFRIGAVYRLQ